MPLPRFRFSIKVLIAVIAVIAVGFGNWIAYSNAKFARLYDLRDKGAIVIIRNDTPKVFQAIGLKHLTPFFDVPTVELYVTPIGQEAMVGNIKALWKTADAKDMILDQASVARSNGAKDVQLILIDDFDADWMMFAEEHEMASIGDSKERYEKRLKANQETGANINP